MNGFIYTKIYVHDRKHRPTLKVKLLGKTINAKKDNVAKVKKVKK